MRILNNDQFLSIANELHGIGQALAAAGLDVAGRHLLDTAAEIDARLPDPVGWWSGGFNGQAGRARLFAAMLGAVRPTFIAETGVFRGNTTAAIAEQFVGPIYGCELDRRWYRAAAGRLAGKANVVIYEMDSRPFLRQVLVEAPAGPALFYLDAHWFRDLPLREELAIILASGRPGAIMIDDFAVPHDEGYNFDDYGPGRRLDLSLLEGLNPAGARLFFPTLPAAQESGARRGCAVIGIGAAGVALAALPELRTQAWTAPNAHQGTDGEPDALPDIEALHRLLNSRWTEVELKRQRDRAMEAELAAAQAVAGAAEALAEATAARRDLAAEVARTASAEAAARGAAEEVERTRVAFLASTSWKITAPLRQVTNWLGRRPPAESQSAG